MTTLSSTERYALFLASEFWKELSRRTRLIVGRCERCGCRHNLQSHHRFYRENWYDTTLSDLEVLCRPCHEKAHGKPIAVRPVQPPRRKKKPRGKFLEFLRKKKKLQAKARSLRKPLKHWDTFRCTPIHHWQNRGASSN
jgi:hypothetical protein